MRVVTEIPDAQYKHLYAVARRTGCEVGPLVAELVRRQLSAPPPEPATDRPRRSNAMTVAEDAQLVRMAREGRNNGEIGRALGRSPQTIFTRRKRLGLPSAPGGRPKFQDR
jgi:DNA-binding NarL/FixJ family response regulator